jgi:hypothetical protein
LCALQSIRLRCSPTGVAARRRPLGIRCSFRVSGEVKYRAYWLHDPALPFGLPPAVRFFLTSLRRPQLSDRCILSSSSTFLQRIAQHILVRQPQSTDTSHGLSLPSAHQGTAVHSTRACRARYVPPSGFGYPLGGLLPPSPCQSCLIPAALMGFTLRSFPLPEGIRRFPGQKNPHAVSPVGFSRRRSSGPAQRTAAPGL